MSRILDPVEEAFFGHQPSPRGSHGVEMPGPATQNLCLGQASKDPVLLLEQDATLAVIPLPFDHAVTAGTIHSDPLSLLHTPSLPSSDFLGPLFAGDLFLSASDRFPHAERAEFKQTHDVLNVTGTTGSGAPHGKALDNNAIDVCLVTMLNLSL